MVESSLGHISKLILVGKLFTETRRAHSARPTQWCEGQSATRSGLVLTFALLRCYIFFGNVINFEALNAVRM